ncbi:MAG: hypothetical protein EA382_08605 [Spirochaetaceae bacterium]|nr:MAG: hypothetical protein EA382_08605 [Spirochaetaceae bacterium]
MADLKSALLTLPDEAFFEIIRNYLGPVRTPFNKHDLVGRLEAFLRTEEIQQRIVSLVDDDDAELLTAIWFLGEPPVDELYAFFAGRRSYIELHQKLLNIEDRLLVYRDDDALRLTPALKPALERDVLCARRLFASRAATGAQLHPTPPWVTDALLISFYSYCVDESGLFRADGVVRKRAATALAAAIPELIVPSAGTDSPRVLLLARALRAVGALAVTGATTPVDSGWELLASLDATGRVAMLVAAVACDDRVDGTESAQTVPPAGTNDLAVAVEAVWNALPAGVAVDAACIERLLVALLPELPADRARRAREAMGLFGVLCFAEDGFCTPARRESPATAVQDTQAQDTQAQGPHSPPRIVVQPNFEVVMPQHIGFDDGLFVARIAALERHDTYPRFEITKPRVARVLQGGASAGQIVDRLRSIAPSVPQNVATTINSWSDEFESIRLVRGVVMTLSPTRRHVASHAHIVELIDRELAPGVYLISDANVERLRTALGDAGVEIVPEVARPRATRTAIATDPHPVSVDRRRLSSFTTIIASSSEEPARLGRREPSAQLKAALESADLSDDQRREMAARIDRKLIITAEQISPEVVRSERSEAKGFDYVGKVRLIEQAIRTGASHLETIERSADGEPIRRLVEPVEIRRTGDELILHGRELPGREPVELRIRKLGLVRRIRAGLVARARAQ